MAARIGSDEARLGRTIVRINTIESTSPLSAGENVDGSSLPPALVPSEPQSPDRAYEEQEVRDRVRAAIASLPPRERKVIGLYYYGEATMKQIGAEIGVNESRVSQLHARAVQRLRKALGADCPTDAISPAVLSFQSTMRRLAYGQSGNAARTRRGAAVPHTAAPHCAKDGRAPEDRGGASGTDRGGEVGGGVRPPVTGTRGSRPLQSSISLDTRSRSFRRKGLASQRQPASSRNRSASVPATSPVTKRTRRAIAGSTSPARGRTPDHPACGIFRSQTIRSYGRSVEALERFDAIAGAIDEKTGIAQRLGDSGTERRFIFDNQRRGADADVAGRRALFRRSRDRRLERPDTDRQLDVEGGAAPRLRLDGQAPAMFLDDRVRDGQPEARSFTDLLRREKRIENLRLHVLGHTRPVVVDLEDHRVAIGVVPGADDQRAAAVRAEHRLLRVDDQVQQHLLHLVRIGKHLRAVPTPAPREC